MMHPADTGGLTALQLRCYEFICEAIDLNGVAPSIEEIRIGMDQRSKSQAHRLVMSLKRRGLVEHDIACHRSIRIKIRHCPNCGFEL